MSWTGSRTHGFVYRRVSWPGWQEGGDYSMFKEGGNLDLSADTSLKAAGSIPFSGEIPPSGDLVRIIYVMDGKEYPMATLFMDVSSPVYGEGVVSGTAALTSVLSVLAEKKFGVNYTVKAGSQAVALAVQLAEECGLAVNNSDASAYTVSEDHVFKPNDSYIKAIDWLLDAAGYLPCFPDAYGVVQMVPKIDPSAGTPAWTFSDGEQSIMLPEVTVEDSSAVPNVCRMWFSNDKESIWATCVNKDPDSPHSTVSRNREVTVADTVSELAGKTQEERIAELKELARKKLIEEVSPTETVTFGHAWVPIAPNDVIAVKYEAHGLLWRGGLVSVRIPLSGAVICQSTAKKTVPTAAKLTTNGGVL